MNLRRSLLLGLALGLTACTTVIGCGSAADEPSKPTVAVQDLKEGLNVLGTDGQLSGAYRKGDRAIYFETRRGAAVLDVYKNLEPSLGDYEMDMRVVDENGRTIFIRQGGDALDPTWERDLALEVKLPRVDPLRRAEDLELLKEASAAIEKASLPAHLGLEKAAVFEAKAAVRDDLLRPAVQKAIQETGYAPGNNSIEIHKKWIVWGVAEHSATWSNVNGVIKDNCQHGACASSMGRVCTATGTGGVQYVEMSTSNASVTGNCTTSYNWNSTGGGHNCHDDSVRAVWGVKYGSQGSSTSGVCSNGASHWYAPSCNETSW
jgi:hypothetical protein